MRMMPAVLPMVWSMTDGWRDGVRRCGTHAAAVLAVCLAVLAAPASVQAKVAVPALTSPVVDTTGTLTPAQVAQLEQQALDLQRRKGSQLQVLIVPSTGREDTADYAQRVFETWQLGRRGVDDGVLLLVAKDDRRARIHVGTGLERAISSNTASRILQTALVPRLSAGDFHGGIAEASARLAQRIEGPGAAPDATQPVRTREQRVKDVLMIVVLIATITAILLIGVGLIVYILSKLLSSSTPAPAPAGPKQYLFRDTLVDANPNAQPRRDARINDDDDSGWSSSSGGASSGGGWSGGGGSSRGGGASGGW